MAPCLSLGVCLFEHVVTGCLSLGVRGGGRSHMYVLVKVTGCGWRGPSPSVPDGPGAFWGAGAGPVEVRGGGEPSGEGPARRERGCRRPRDVLPVHLRRRLAQEVPVGTGLVASLCLGDQSGAQASRFGEKGSRRAPRNHSQPSIKHVGQRVAVLVKKKKKSVNVKTLYI